MKLLSIAIALLSAVSLAPICQAQGISDFCPEQCTANANSGGGAFPGLVLELTWASVKDGNATWIECDTCQSCQGTLTIKLFKAQGVEGEYGWGYNGFPPTLVTTIKSDDTIGSESSPTSSSEKHYLGCTESKLLTVSFSDGFGHGFTTTAGLTCGGC